jgi:IS4 transposase
MKPYIRQPILELYRVRWGIESFFGILKTRLGLENFTGKSAEFVYQDFYSSVYLTGIEVLLTESSQAFLSSKKNTLCSAYESFCFL